MIAGPDAFLKDKAIVEVLAKELAD